MSTKPQKGSPLGQSRVEAARNGTGVPVFAIGVGVLVLALIIGAVVIAVAGGEEGGTLAAGDQAYGEVTVTGDPLPTYADGGEDPAVGQPAPTLEGDTPSGEPVTIDPGEGPMVIAFLAHWCPHCQAEVPRLVELADDSGEIDGVPITAVLTGTDPTRGNFPPGEWLAGEDWPGPAMVDSEPDANGAFQAQTAYGVAGYPFLVAIDGDGNVVARSSGELGDDGLRAFFAEVGSSS